MQSRLHLTSVVLTCLMLHSRAGGAEAWVMNNERTHLRSGSMPEWEEFAARTPDGRQLDLRFTAQPNASEATLFIQQDDVRQDWLVELNGKRLGNLFLMEADLVHALAIPARVLKAGENVLSVIPPRENDDIVLHDIRIVSQPLAEVLRKAAIAVRVVEQDTDNALPCRITIVNAQSALAPLINLSNAPSLAVRPGVAYTGNGSADIGLPTGEYTVFASRGFEWNVATQRVQVASGKTAQLKLQLSRSVPTPGWISCDPHTHTLTHGGHGDASLEERMLTLAGEGIELPVATEHNKHIDYANAARRTGVAEWFTPVTGNEVTTQAGHFNIFPVDPAARPPDSRITDWSRLMTALRATPQVRVVVLNHPRNFHNNFQPFASNYFNAVTGENLRGPEFSFDAMEVLNSSAQQSDFMLVYRDWFALLNHGYRITAVGSSDGHDVSRYIVGQGRTYIACPDGRPDRVDVATACSNLLAGRALVSMGLLTDMTVNKRFKVGDVATNLGAQVRVTVRVLSPPWAVATNVSLFANGHQVREQALDHEHDRVVTWTLARPKHDVHLVAIATGPGITAPYWAIPRPYQPSSPRWDGRVIGSTNPIWLDGDGDGRLTAARAYAKRLVNEHGADPVKLVSALNAYDEAVGTQAASFYAAAGQSLNSPSLAKALKDGAPQVQRGFNAFAETQP